MNSAWPKPRKKLPPRATALDPYKFVIDQMLRADLDAPRKQRHTVTRIFHRLVEENGAEDISYQIVRRYAADRKPEILAASGKAPVEAFVPQSHQPGMEAEVDFGERPAPPSGADLGVRPQRDWARGGSGKASGPRRGSGALNRSPSTGGGGKRPVQRSGVLGVTAPVRPSRCRERRAARAAPCPQLVAAASSGWPATRRAVRRAPGRRQRVRRADAGSRSAAAGSCAMEEGITGGRRGRAPLACARRPFG